MPFFLPGFRRAERVRAAASAAVSADHTANLGPREVKASRTALAFTITGRPVWTPRDYAALAREGYLKNPIVHRAVRLISEAAASVPWLLYEGARELDRHPVLDLLGRPNEREAGPAFLERLYGHLLVAGNAYVECVAIDARPRELHALRPDRMRVVPGADGWPEAYEYTVDGRTVRFSQTGRGVRPILHVSTFHPLNDHYGAAPLEAALTSLDVHNATTAWAKALIDNSARPSGALVYQPKDGGNLTDEQFERLKAELEAGYQGARNAGRPLLLDGGLDWKAMAYSPKDLDFVEGKREAAREIALAFGVPPMLLGIPGDNTFANYAEAHRALWRLTVLPLVSRTAAALSHWLEPAYPGVRLGFDTDRVDALASEREALWSRVGAASFLSDDEKRQAVGYGAREASHGSRD
jgi:HK97 family phage portal protein